jgi:hypothetical protein
MRTRLEDAPMKSIVERTEVSEQQDVKEVVVVDITASEPAGLTDSSIGEL